MKFTISNTWNKGKKNIYLIKAHQDKAIARELRLLAEHEHDTKEDLKLNEIMKTSKGLEIEAKFVTVVKLFLIH